MLLCQSLTIYMRLQLPLSDYGKITRFQPKMAILTNSASGVRFLSDCSVQDRDFLKLMEKSS